MSLCRRGGIVQIPVDIGTPEESGHARTEFPRPSSPIVLEDDGEAIYSALDPTEVQGILEDGSENVISVGGLVDPLTTEEVEWDRTPADSEVLRDIVGSLKQDFALPEPIVSEVRIRATSGPEPVAPTHLRFHRALMGLQPDPKLHCGPAQPTLVKEMQVHGANLYLGRRRFVSPTANWEVRS